MAMKKSIEELDTELCNYCPLEERRKGANSMGSCEGCKCDEAYQNYLDYEEETDEN